MIKTGTFVSVIGNGINFIIKFTYQNCTSVSAKRTWHKLHTDHRIKTRGRIRKRCPKIVNPDVSYNSKENTQKNDKLLRLCIQYTFHSTTETNIFSLVLQCFFSAFLSVWYNVFQLRINVYSNIYIHNTHSFTS